MIDTELLSAIEEIIKKYQQKNQHDYDDLRVKINDIHSIHADTIHVMSSFKEFFQKSSSLFGPESAATKVASKKTTKKKVEDTMKMIDYQKVDKPTRYNSYVRLIKEDEEFSDMVVSAWRSVDKKISADPHAIDYLKFYELFISSKAKATESDEILGIIDKVEDQFKVETKKKKKVAKEVEEDEEEVVVPKKTVKKTAKK
jgi:hypothetical protein